MRPGLYLSQKATLNCMHNRITVGTQSGPGSTKPVPAWQQIWPLHQPSVLPQRAPCRAWARPEQGYSPTFSANEKQLSAPGGFIYTYPLLKQYRGANLNLPYPSALAGKVPQLSSSCIGSASIRFIHNNSICFLLCINISSTHWTSLSMAFRNSLSLEHKLKSAYFQQASSLPFLWFLVAELLSGCSSLLSCPIASPRCHNMSLSRWTAQPWHGTCVVGHTSRKGNRVVRFEESCTLPSVSLPP